MSNVPITIFIRKPVYVSVLTRVSEAGLSEVIEDALLQYFNISIVELVELRKNKRLSQIAASSEFLKSKISSTQLIHVLNSNKTIRLAAIELGTSSRTIHRLIKKFNITKDTNSKSYCIV